MAFSERYSALVGEYFHRLVREPGTDLEAVKGSFGHGMRLKIGANLEDGRLVKVGFRAFACPHIIACCNYVVERLEGGPAGQLVEISIDELQEKFEVPVEKTGKLLILKDALRVCHDQYLLAKAT